METCNKLLLEGMGYRVQQNTNPPKYNLTRNGTTTIYHPKIAKYVEFLNIEALHQTVSVMEDELKASYSFEIEDIERGYTNYIDSLNDYDSVFQMIREARTIKEY